MTWRLHAVQDPQVAAPAITKSAAWVARSMSSAGVWSLVKYGKSEVVYPRSSRRSVMRPAIFFIAGQSFAITTALTVIGVALTMLWSTGSASMTSGHENMAPSAATTVIVESWASNPRETWNGSHGDAS